MSDTPSVPPGWTPPPWPPPASAESGSSRRVVKILVAIGVVVMAGVVTLAVVFGPRIWDAVTGPGRAASAYLATMRDDNPDGGYRLLCKEVRPEDPAVYQKMVTAANERDGHVLRYRVTRSQVITGNGGTVGRADVIVTTTKGTSRIVVLLRKEQGQWHWCTAGPAPKEHTVTFHFP